MNEIIRGYKILKPEYFNGCDKDIILPHNKMHFCRRLLHCFRCKSFSPGNKIIEVETHGYVISGSYLCWAEELRIIREIPYHEALEIINRDIMELSSTVSCNNDAKYNIPNYSSASLNCKYYLN